MIVNDSLLEKLEASLAGTSGVYANTDVDPQAYFSDLAADIRSHACTCLPLTATVMPPGFLDAAVGSAISGQCVEQNSSGHWLVYRPEQDQFYCFWGADRGNLSAHGVFGSPLYCWSA